MDSINNEAVTPKALFDQRRKLIQLAASGVFGLSLSSWFSREAISAEVEAKKMLAKTNSDFVVKEPITSFKNVTSYNNFYEFGVNKEDPAIYAHTLQTRPWTISIEGLVQHPQVFDLDDLIKLAPLEERIYRLRCVEGWSMVIPWIGYSLSTLIKKVQPLGSAKFIEFTSLADKKQMPGVSSSVLKWPYTEGLRLDEANHPLTLLTFGLYGEALPKQNGAPVRVVVPWKYGFKSAKSLVRIRLLENQPTSSWTLAAPNEYGFYSNVNPNVDHPRWSQASERRIGDERGIFAPRRKTLMFNGYADQVASLYAGMDLKKYY